MNYGNKTKLKTQEPNLYRLGCKVWSIAYSQIKFKIRRISANACIIPLHRVFDSVFLYNFPRIVRGR